VIESLTGVKLEDLIERIPGLKGKSSKAQETEGRG
jgi:hypothetical protein